MYDLDYFQSLYYKAFFDEKIVNSAFDTFIEVQQQKIYNIDSELPKALKKYKEYEKKKQSKGYNEEKAKNYKYYATKEGFLKTNNEYINTLNEYRNNALIRIKNKNKSYINAVEYFVNGKDIDFKKNDLNEFKWFFETDFIGSVFLIVFTLLIEEEDKSNEVPKIIKETKPTKNIFIRYFDNFITNGALISDFMTKYGIDFATFYLAILTYITLLLTRYNHLLKQANKNFKYEQIPLNFFEYEDRATLTETPLLNELALTKLEDRDIKVINGDRFVLDNISTIKSNETIEKLTELDRFILNTAVLDIYYTKGDSVFSDRQLATLYSNKYGRENVSPKLLDEINKSLLKLQSIRISLDYKNQEKAKKTKIKGAKRDNPLLWLERLEVKEDTTSNFYRLIEIPFYLTYLQDTHAKLLSYDRGVLFKPIKGVKKTSENQALRSYLNRRLVSLNTLDTNIYISVKDIYEVLEIKADDYKNDNQLRKARYNAREKTEKILNEFKKEYSFNFNQDNEKRGIKGYIITPKK